MANPPGPAKRKVLVVGGGFAGLAAAKQLGRVADLAVELVDRRNYHLFQPLLYQVAMAALSPAEIAVPIRSILAKHASVTVTLGEVITIDAAARLAILADGSERSYDYLLLGTGATHSYFGRPDWELHAPGLKTLEQATEIRRRVLTSFERAESEPDPASQRRWLTFAIVGGGPTGVELAGALGEISRFTLSSDFRRIDPARTRVVLLEAGPRILAGFPELLSARAARDLEALGVQVWTSTRVTEVTAEGVALGREFLEAATVIWAAGILSSPLGAQLPARTDSLGRVPVRGDLSIEGHPEIFVIGDLARVEGADGSPLPGLAPIALQEGRHAARNILADLKGRPRSEFRYVDKGMMATVGRKSAIATIGGARFSGILAWAAWLLIHIYYLIGFKNRFFVLVDWAWSYLSYRRGARLIVDKEWRSREGAARPDPSERC